MRKLLVPIRSAFLCLAMSSAMFPLVSQVTSYAFDSSSNAASSSVSPEDLAVSAAVESFYNTYIKDQIPEDIPNWRFKREMVIIQYLVSHVDYAASRYHARTIQPIDYTAYGALIKQEAVCSGYARAFDLLAARCNLESAYISTQSHAWNQVKLDDGKWYHVDTTWEDPITREGLPNKKFGFGTLWNQHINLDDTAISIAQDRQAWSSEVVCDGVDYGSEAVGRFMRNEGIKY